LPEPVGKWGKEFVSHKIPSKEKGGKRRKYLSRKSPNTKKRNKQTTIQEIGGDKVGKKHELE